MYDEMKVETAIETMIALGDLLGLRPKEPADMIVGTWALNGLPSLHRAARERMGFTKEDAARLLGYKTISPITRQEDIRRRTSLFNIVEFREMLNHFGYDLQFTIRKMPR